MRLARQRRAKARPVSIAKQEETWSHLWSEWYEIIAEAAQEDGRYIIQEPLWEPPYFDDAALAEDLAKVAEKMQPLLETAFQNWFYPDEGFAEALQGAVEEITGALPEWIDVDVGLELEEHLTNCFLAWEWLVAQEERQDAFLFTERVRSWKDSLSNANLDGGTLLGFFAERSEADQRLILAGLTSHKEAPLWKLSLRNAYSHWHALYMHPIDLYTPERYLENLRTTIPQQWQAGLPVIEDLLARKEYRESLTVITETVDSLLKSVSGGEGWTPEAGLLSAIVYGHHQPGDDWANYKTLLRHYQQTARGLKQVERVNALAIQLTAFDRFFDWKAMFKCFAEVEVADETRNALFRSWRNRIVRETKPSEHGYGYVYEYGRAETAKSWWLHWLLDSVYDPEKGPTW